MSPDAAIETSRASPAASELTHKIKDRLRAVAQEFLYVQSAQFSAKLIADIAVRHAGGAIFQEAHFDLVRAGPPDLFGSADLAQVKINTRGGVHFTPPALARIIAEDVIRVLDTENSMIIFDPACGSGAFLYEALRTVGRINQSAKIQPVGRDISENAISMARFLLLQACRDWPSLDINLDLKTANSLHEDVGWNEADAILMNPPFVSWSAMSTEQRSETKRILGKLGKGKPDYCMAFIERAVELSHPGCVTGTLFPASLLGIKSATPWRKALLERVHPNLISSFGDHGLFRYALVQVGAMVMKRKSDVDRDELQSVRELWVGDSSGATGNALRALRRLRPSNISNQGNDWTLTVTHTSTLTNMPDWRPRPRRLRDVLVRVAENFQSTVAHVFSVSEGVRAGARETFTLNVEEFTSLPQTERRFFRPVAEGRNVRMGHILEGAYLFFPYGSNLPSVESEDDLRKLVPEYYERWLAPAREALSERIAITRRTGAGSKPRWWELNWPRPWQFEPRMKIVSAYFGGRGSFAFDDTGVYAVLQGHAWLPKKRDSQGKSAPLDKEWSLILHQAYTAFLNSRPFEKLLTEFCPRVAGGQFELSKRFVDPIPIPDLPKLIEEDLEIYRTVTLLANLSPDQFSDTAMDAEIDRLVATLYGVPIDEWS